MAPAETPTMLRVFASVFYREVDGPLLHEITSRRTELTEAFGDDCLAGLDLTDENAVLEALAIEYCRLFVGPSGHMPPVESIALGQERFWGEATESVAAFYEACGVKPEMSERLLPDHLSMELDCVAVLIEDGHEKEAHQFARTHLLQWLPALICHVDQCATLPFYRLWLVGLQEALRGLCER